MDASRDRSALIDISPPERTVIQRPAGTFDGRIAVASFTLMQCWGLQTGETPGCCDPNTFTRGYNLDVVSAKGNRSRRLPLSSEVTEVLAGCDRPRGP